jgi:hypothetical protein
VPSDTAVPVDAGQSATSTGVKQAASSILPSGRERPRATEAPPAAPTVAGGLIPPYVAEKGVAGIATFYAYHQGQAAAAARLRDALGPNWRGMVVRVDGPLGSLNVRITDYESSKIPGRLIDLSSADFLTLCGPLSRGICSVVVTHG